MFLLVSVPLLVLYVCDASVLFLLFVFGCSLLWLFVLVVCV